MYEPMGFSCIMKKMTGKDYWLSVVMVNAHLGFGLHGCVKRIHSKSSPLSNEHNCARNFKLGSNVNYRWIGSHFTKEVLENEKLNVRMLKEEVKNNSVEEQSNVQCLFLKGNGCPIDRVDEFKEIRP
uniref:Uncharacterized protein n=1 Tax=Lactuca sativa TaxID=4236 RepID=A0A9R1XWX8_LACSA|nr:hypothetical protein LSAT_V11C100008360 [Lactuca sativa]